MGLLDSVIGAVLQGQQQGGPQAGGMGGADLGGLLGGLLGGGQPQAQPQAGGMGGLGNVLGGLGGAGGAGALLSIVLGMLGNNSQHGGLGGLVEAFGRKGMGDVVGSWIGTGQNQSIHPDQLGSVLGNDTLAQIAQQLGVSPGEAAGQLSQLLPEVIDRLTPHGQMPQGGLGNAGDLLSALLKR